MTHTVALEGGRAAAYHRLGRGDPLLAFTGGPGLSAEPMLSFAELLAHRFTCYVIEPHGIGGSSPPERDEDYSPEGHARFYDEVRRALGLDRVSVMGHSFGSIVALSFAALFGDETIRCIASGVFVVGEDADEAEGGAASQEMEKFLARHEQSEWYPEARAVWDAWTERVLAAEQPDTVAQMLETVLPLYAAHPERPDVRSRLASLPRPSVDLRASKVWEAGLQRSIDIRHLLGKVRCPTLIVVGDKDIICGPAQAAYLQGAIADATIVTIAECGHLFAQEEPAAFKRAVEEWLDGLD